MPARCHWLPALPCLLTLWYIAGPGARPSRADVIYTYTGNAFNEFPVAGVGCPPVCNVSGSFTVAKPLAANLNLATITPLSFSISSGGVTLVDGVPTPASALEISTDSSGKIVNWVWVEAGPADDPIARILTEDVNGLTADDVRLSSYGVQPPPFYGQRVGQVSDDPGTWTETQGFDASTNTGLTVGADGFTASCFPVGPQCDPTITTRLGGHSETVDGTFSLSADVNGNINFDAVNGGDPIGDILIKTLIDPTQLQEGYGCSGSVFTECGFRIDPSDTTLLDILFDNQGSGPAIPTGEHFVISGDGWVLTPVPEPGSWVLLLTAGAGLVGLMQQKRPV